MFDKLNRVLSSVFPASPLDLPADYVDALQPSRAELGRMAWAAGDTTGLAFEALREDEQERYCRIGAALFEAGVSYENQRILGRIETMQSR